MEALMQDLRYGARMLRRARLHVVGGADARLGIGANTAIFSVVNAVLLRPLPYRRAGRLVSRLRARLRPDSDERRLVDRDFLDWRERSTVFEHIAAYGSAAFNLTAASAARLDGRVVDAEFFRVLGVAAALGRTFLPRRTARRPTRRRAQPRPLAAPLRRRPRRRRTDDRPQRRSRYTIVGVMPRGVPVP